MKKSYRRLAYFAAFSSAFSVAVYLTSAIVHVEVPLLFDVLGGCGLALLVLAVGVMGEIAERDSRWWERRVKGEEDL